MKAGVIEGFFGKPWGWSARLSAPEFLGDFGYQFYIYAPKAEPFLRRLWRDPIPAETLQRLRDVSDNCRAQAISFGIGLTPFEIYLNYDTSAQASLRSKVRQINEIGVAILCVLFDDMRGDIAALSDIQAKVVSDICAWSTAEHFILCPTYYSYDARLAREFGPPPKSYLRDLSRIVEPRIDFFWTGEKVISNGYSADHLADVAEVLGRKPFIWDNHISNDSKIRTNHLFLDPTGGRWTLPRNLVSGLAINPMNQPHLSRIALCGYRKMMADGAQDQPVLPAVCRELLEPIFAERILCDADLLQKAGLNQLDAETRRSLLDVYGSEQSNSYASEIAAWLRGEYAFDPQCLT